ncbi:C-type lectin domain family 4 member E isoform X1 [Dicentrarchus labrax]|uniref:C-type lectin domain family 4 member E isoform X1 n=1 Tax=Dicentrarchus labrax TaxID=13489 RepID=UPI0016311187|nr:C-type lectin domain family 4 member E isoform X1 [Dicentrarchus labrax]
MEMQEISTEGERKKEDEGASEPMLEAKTEVIEEAEPDPYSKLQNPAEDVYAEAFYGDAPVKTKAGKQAEGNTRLYRVVCLFLTIICLVLLVVVVILSLKLQNGSTVCPEREETKTALTCNYEQCQDLLPKSRGQYRSCHKCADGWLTFGQSCFFLSTTRLSWDESQKNCSARGGSLAVISSPRVQRFLTKEGKFSYWIGLRQSGDTWTWVNDDSLQESYWTEGTSAGNCGMLKSNNPPEKNWLTAQCHAYTYYICQMQL